MFMKYLCLKLSHTYNPTDDSITCILIKNRVKHLCVKSLSDLLQCNQFFRLDCKKQLLV